MYSIVICLIRGTFYVKIVTHILIAENTAISVLQLPHKKWIFFWRNRTLLLAFQLHTEMKSRKIHQLIQLLRCSITLSMERIEQSERIYWQICYTITVVKNFKENPNFSSYRYVIWQQFYKLHVYYFWTFFNSIKLKKLSFWSCLCAKF